MYIEEGGGNESENFCEKHINNIKWSQNKSEFCLCDIEESLKFL